ncbi:Nitrogen assimilation regulatory protein [bacterium HR21]|nr:Nitrogen assimilation regulatory protein [bacterium HR21]
MASSAQPVRTEEEAQFQLLQWRYGIVGQSEALRQAMRLLLQVAPTELTVLITGETGTGKELFARAIHGLSPRRRHPFVSLNCAAIPETLLESELFGHVRGAFTGATSDRQGFFEVAHQGTLFLDEIGEMPLSTQAKVLRVLESGEFSPLGSSEIRRVDVRLIAATNRDLERAVREGTFRQDLYYRLNAVRIHLPPLRERPEDIPVLVEYFAARICERLGITFEGIAPEALELLQRYPWPGNVRELRNVVETLLTLERGAYITAEMVQRYLQRAAPGESGEAVPVERAIVAVGRARNEPALPAAFDTTLLYRVLLDMRSELAELRRALQFLLPSIEALREQLATLEHRVEQPKEAEEGIRLRDEADFRLDDIERRLIIAALKRFGGNRRLAARALGISERTLYRKLAQYGLGDIL